MVEKCSQEFVIIITIFPVNNFIGNVTMLIPKYVLAQETHAKHIIKKPVYRERGNERKEGKEEKKDKLEKKNKDKT